MMEQEKPIVHQGSRWVFLGHIVARLLDVSHPGDCGHRGQPQGVKDLDMKTSNLIQKKSGGWLGEGTFWIPPFFSCMIYDSTVIYCALDTQVRFSQFFRVLAVSIIGCWPIVPAMAVLGITYTWSHLKITLFVAKHEC